MTGDCSGLPLPGCKAFSIVLESVVKPSMMRRCDPSVKTAIRVPGGIVCRYWIIRRRTYTWSASGVFSASSSSTFAALVTA